MSKYKMDLVEGLRKLSTREYEDLESSCMEHGVLDSLKTWNGYLLDGRHRLKIADKHGLRYEVEEVELEDEEQARQWILEHQLGRRNLTEGECQRVRAKMAQETSPAEAADYFDVSERTIRRDVEMDRNMKLMSEDVRKRCDSGAIINSQADWKRYGTLTDEERKAVDDKLRKDPTLCMRDALPEKTKNLSPDDLKVVNENENLSPKAKRELVTGKVRSDHKAVQQLAKLPPDECELLSTIIEDPEVEALSQALKVLKGPDRPKDPADKVPKLIHGLLDQLDRVRAKLEDIGAVSQVDISPCMATYRKLRTQCEALK